MVGRSLAGSQAARRPGSRTHGGTSDARGKATAVGLLLLLLLLLACARASASSNSLSPVCDDIVPLQCYCWRPGRSVRSHWSGRGANGTDLPASGWPAGRRSQGGTSASSQLNRESSTPVGRFCSSQPASQPAANLVASRSPPGGQLGDSARLAGCPLCSRVWFAFG